MHITLETDYAVRIVDALARKKLNKIDSGEKSRRMDAGTIAEQTGVPLRFALKILRKLVSGNVVKSYKGIYGGYELCRELNEISLYDIVEIVEGVYMFSRCLNSEYDRNCNYDGILCIYREVFGDISKKVCEELGRQTFDKLVKGE